MQSGCFGRGISRDEKFNTLLDFFMKGNRNPSPCSELGLYLDLWKIKHVPLGYIIFHIMDNHLDGALDA